jgi:shikimate dehydrogenase
MGRNRTVKDVYTFADLQNWAAAGGNEEPPIRLAIFGHPVAHSLSPQMQNAALRECGIAMQYARFDIASQELAPALRLLPSLGFIGVNLTAPHKIHGARIADQLDDFARRVGAVNTIRVEDDQLVGFNTDGAGFAHAIRAEFSVDLRDLRVLLLGAGGGAGRTIAMQCASEGCERLVLTNRTAEKPTRSWPS